jgi:uncharacterized protein DUF7009
MKLRLNSNSVRLRLSQSEVDALGERGRVEERIQFAPDRELLYSVECADTPEPSAAMEGTAIRVKLPRTEVKHWIETDQTGIEASQGSLRLVIEKDFKCIHRDSPEDADSFPNPLAVNEQE